MKDERKKDRKNKMFIILGILISIIILLIVWFNIPYSPLNNEFNKDLAIAIEENKNYKMDDKFTKEDFSHLPIPIQKYVENCGFLGQNKISYIQVEYKDVDFKQGKDKPALVMDYVHYNFVNPPIRMAMIESSMFGIPFQGYDYYKKGIGGMRGVIAKSITLFNEQGPDMDIGALSTLLAESFLAPSIFLQNYIEFELVNDYEIKATISYKNQIASGSFYFNEAYEMIKFRTESRPQTDAQGKVNYIPWSGVCTDYIRLENGIKRPSKLQAIWHYEDGDLIYFDGNITDVIYK